MLQSTVMMNIFKINKTYSSLHESYLRLYKELSTVKEKNEQLMQRVKELETNNLTKEEMKGMIKEGLALITNILLGKETETVNAQTQTDNEMELEGRQIYM